MKPSFIKKKINKKYSDTISIPSPHFHTSKLHFSFFNQKVTILTFNIDNKSIIKKSKKYSRVPKDGHLVTIAIQEKKKNQNLSETKTRTQTISSTN